MIMNEKEKISATDSFPAFLASESRALLPVKELPSLAAAFVHEVRNPLAAIHMHLQLLENYVQEVNEKNLQEKIQNKVSFIKGEISRLDQTLHNFISLIRPRQLLPSESFDLNEIVQEVVNLLTPQAREENITIEFKAGNFSKISHLDPIMIRQIVLNLLLNSLQAFQNETDTFKDRKIDVITGEQKNLIFIEISDNGPGIAAEVQRHMFEPFYSTRKGKGSGLGLAIVKKMISSMKGHLQVHSEVNQGATFIVLFQKIPN